ncbi:MAG: ABC transporter substrate-binding protein [Methanocalculaceae archaeon]|jgi:iron complex transport system substrate-binding protein|nr:ABC transporter substrate-binding protein [Methanocalculaceae archaeon]
MSKNGIVAWQRLCLQVTCDSRYAESRPERECDPIASQGCNAAILIALVLFAVAAAFCGDVVAEETRTFVDDAGREITLPVKIEAVSPSGPLAQIVLYSFDPDLFVSVSSEFTAVQRKYVNPRMLTLPVTGQFYGSKASTMNPESILELNKRLNIDVILDVGEEKGTLKEDLDTIQRKTGVAFAFVTQNKLADIPDSYVMLGELLSRPERGQEFFDYISALLDEFDFGMTTIGGNKKSLIYVTAIDGNSVLMVGNGSYHAEVIDYVGNNVAKPSISSSGTGDGYTMEDILQLNPDFIIVAYAADHAYYKKILSDPMWQSLSAVQSRNVYEAPNGPYNWMGSPPSIQRLLSMIWIGNLLYPEIFDYNTDDRVKEFYSLFFHYNLTDEVLSDLMIYAKSHTLPTPAPPRISAPLFWLIAGLVVTVFAAGRRRY